MSKKRSFPEFKTGVVRESNRYIRFVINLWLWPGLVFLSFFCLIPFDYLYQFPLVYNFSHFMAGIFKAVDLNYLNSEFPEYSIVYLSFINAIGLISLLLTFFYRSIAHMFDMSTFNGGLDNAITLIVGVFIIIPLFLYTQLFLEAVDYLGCVDCSYKYKASLLVGGYFWWVCIHTLILSAFICVDFFVNKK